MRKARFYISGLATLAAISCTAAPAGADETGLASMHSWRLERGRTCMVDHFHYGNGEGRTKKQARDAAIKSWQEFAAFEYGTDWAHFRRAGSRSIGYSATTNGWSATVEARPCNTKRRR